MENLHQILKSMSGKKAVVVGDLYVDEYVHGVMENISQEGPIPVVRAGEKVAACGGRPCSGAIARTWLDDRLCQRGR